MRMYATEAQWEAAERGRWTIHTMQMGLPGTATLGGPLTRDLPVAVVPCDSSSLERAVEAAMEAISDSTDVIRDGEEPGDGWALKLAERAVLAAFAAAAGTT